MKLFSDFQAFAGTAVNAVALPSALTTTRFACRNTLASIVVADQMNCSRCQNSPHTPECGSAAFTPRPGDANLLESSDSAHPRRLASLFSQIQEMRRLSQLVLLSFEHYPQILPSPLRAAIAALPDDYEKLLQLADASVRALDEHVPRNAVNEREGK